MTTYTVQDSETLPSIAERLGHAGEWQALALANLALIPDTDPPLSDEAKAVTVAERARTGVELTVPAEWAPAPPPPPPPARSSSKTPL